MYLNPGEMPLHSELVYGWMPPRHVPGVLHLTTWRLVFETAPPPNDIVTDILGAGAQTTLVDLYVNAISNATAHAGHGGWHTLRVEAHSGMQVFQFQTPRAQDWAQAILQAGGGAPAPPTPPPAPGAPAIPPCPKCGHVPTSTGGRFCSWCGATVTNAPPPP